MSQFLITKLRERRYRYSTRFLFMSRHKDTRGLCCPKIWVKPFSEYSDVKTELSFNSYNYNGDDKTFCMVILTSVINYPEVANVNSNSGFKAQSKRRRVINRGGSIKRNKDTGSLWGSRV